MTSLPTRLFRGAVALSLIAPSVSALASPVTDLEGARAAGALEDMDRRGYVQTSSYKADGGSYTYWWNRDTKSCVRLLTRDGRIAATKTSTAQDCGQRSSGGGGNDAAAAAIAGAAILAGVAALSHKSHHRNDQEYNDSQSYAEFERGHRDGLMAHSFADYNNSKQYRDGYQSGVNERGYQSGYRSDNRSYQTSSYRSVTPVYVDDLQGARASGALSDLESRGFRSVDSFQSGSNGAGTVWWNGRTRQCVQVITVDGHIDSVSDIGTHPRCR
jgi:hypothetical protein